MYKVIKAFHDLKDYKKVKNGEIYHHYEVGDIYPRQGLTVNDDRIKELSGNENAQGVPLIKEVKENARKS